MHSPDRMQALAHLRAAAFPSPVRTISITPPMTAAGFLSSSAVTLPAPVTGQTSTHLPQRVQASAIAWARASNAASNVATAGSGIAWDEGLTRQRIASARRIEGPAAAL